MAASTGAQLVWNGVVRNWYNAQVMDLEWNDSFQRSFTKSMARTATPAIVRTPLEIIRPSVGPPSHPLGYIAELFPEEFGMPMGSPNSSNALASKVANGLSIGGKALVVVSVGIEVAQVYNSENPLRSGTGAVGALGGGLAGGIAGGAIAGVAGGFVGGVIAGATAGSIVPGAGTAVGAFVGGAIALAGSVAGSYYGGTAGREFGNSVYDTIAE